MSSSDSTPSPRATEELRTAYLRIQNSSAASRLWERVLTVADRERLGNDLETAYRDGGCVGMWVRLRDVTLQRATIEVAKQLNFLTDNDYQWLLREYGENDDAEEAFDAAIRAGHLVLVEDPREAYWNGEQIKIDWYNCRALWEFVWELSRSAKAGESIDRFSFGDRAPENVITKRKSRLAKLEAFPVTLSDKIVVAGRGTQRLDVPREQIRIFERDNLHQLAEWNP